MSDPGWERAALALRLLAVDPAGLGGVHLRARAGPVRAVWLDALATLPLPLRRIHPGIEDAQLLGGLDLTATLAAGRPVASQGLLAAPAALVLTMAERTPPGLAARLAQALDGGTGHALILLDEGADPDEAAPLPLTDRLAFGLDLDAVPLAAALPLIPTPTDAGLAAARQRLAGVALPRDAIAALVTLAARFGIDSLRAPLLAAAAARAHAALAGRSAVAEADIAAAAGLVYPARATRLPAEAEAAPPPPDDGAAPEAQPAGEAGTLPDELLVEAVRAALPPDVLARLAAAPAAGGGSGGSGAGAARRGNRRGRPLPSRPGRPGQGARIDLVATLRTAAPWQALRRAAAPGAAPGLRIRPSDIRIRRYDQPSDRLLVFAVDASGSAAMARMAEAKGAVEILLAEAYARRDHVALIGFRGAGAEILLPPTRSLVQTKRRLAGLPGGGATPLAAGLREAAGLARQARQRGLSPALVLLTDGRANVALDGGQDRARAAEDALRMARLLAADRLQALVIDTAARPQPALVALAGAAGGRYLALPRAEARGLSGAVAAALGG